MAQLIPKIFHAIWIGPYANPRISDLESWHKTHPDYQFILWNIDKPETKQYIDEAIELLGGLERLEAHSITYVCDLIRLLILRDYGGLYLDHDILLLKRLDPLLDGYQLVLTFQYDSKDRTSNVRFPLGFKLPDLIRQGYATVLFEDRGTVNNCFIGSVPDHPLLKKVAKLTVENHFKEPQMQLPMSDWTVGPYALTQVLQDFGMPVELASTIQENNIAIYHRDLLHPVRGGERFASGKQAYDEKIKSIIEEKASYAVHYHEHFGAELFLKKKIILFSKWYRDQFLK